MTERQRRIGFAIAVLLGVAAVVLLSSGRGASAPHGRAPAPALNPDADGDPATSPERQSPAFEARLTARRFAQALLAFRAGRQDAARALRRTAAPDLARLLTGEQGRRALRDPSPIQRVTGVQGSVDVAAGRADLVARAGDGRSQIGIILEQRGEDWTVVGLP